MKNNNKEVKEIIEALIKLKKSHLYLYNLLTTKAKNELIDYEKQPAVIKANEIIEKFN